ncbi:MAG: hypothetical protein QOE03_2157 [Micromonosporaceae bacterium]|nr:hypothetical protein [Micromonosporaceae bacterium]
MARIPGEDAPPTFNDGAEPTAYLKPIGEPEEIKDPLATFQEALDTLDPGAWVMNAINDLFGSNPVEEAMARLGGDWVAYAKCAEAFRNLGEFFQAVGWNLKWGNDSLDGWWSGQAADAAWIHFDTLAQHCLAHREVLREIADQYETAARSAFHFAQAGGPIAAAIIDAAIVAGIAAAAGTASSETVVGGIIGYGIAGFEIYEIGEKVDHLFRLIGLTDATIQAVGGTLGSIVGTSPDVLAGFSGISLATSGAGPTLPGGAS